MSEWGVVGVIITLAGLFGTVLPPIIKLTNQLAILNTNMAVMNDKIKELSVDNSNGHRKIWEHNERQDKLMSEHERRIFVLEK